MKRRRRNHGAEKAAAAAAVIFIILLAAAAVWTDKAIRPVAEAMAEHLSVAETEKAVEEAVSGYIAAEGYSYSDFVTIRYDSSGHVAAVEAIAQNINKAQSEIALEINKRLADSAASASVPAGSLTGSYLLAGKGFNIRLRICPARKASVTLRSEFISAGNNQTRHSITAEVTADIKSTLPVYSFEATTSFEFLLAESIIVGEVPETSIYAWNEYQQQKSG